MQSISVSKLKASLSEQLRLVKCGETIVVVERGRPVARLIPMNEPASSADWSLAGLERDGILRRGSQALSRDFWSLPVGPDPTGTVRGAVGEDRDERW